MADEVGKLRAQVRDLKREVSDLQNDVMRAERRAVAAGKAQAKSEAAAANLDAYEERAKGLEAKLAHALADNVSLQARADKASQVLRDVAALKRLVG